MISICLRKIEMLIKDHQNKMAKINEKLNNPRKSKINSKLADYPDKSQGTVVKALMLSVLILIVTVSCLIFWIMIGSKNSNIKAPLNK